MDFVRINNRNNFLVGEVPSIYPKSIKYRKYWKEQKKRCIEGFWGVDDAQYNIPDICNFNIDNNSYKGNKYRYMTPQIYFYVNFGTIKHKEEGAGKTVPKKFVKPHLRDVEWEFGYNWLEAIGFSGFEDDDEYTCLREVELYNNGEIEKDDIHSTAINSKGEIKTYVPARKYLRQLFSKPLGRPLYWNDGRNLFMLGSRGYGKSYLAGVAVMLHEFIFDGAKYYNKETIENPYTVEILIGAAMASKSADTLAKFNDALNKLPGDYTDSKKYYPSPLFKHTTGTLKAGNSKNPFRNEYEKKIGGEWKATGTGTNIKNVTYTIDNPEAAVGTRPGRMLIEEVGLVSNLLAVHAANETCQVEGTEKFGSSLYLGTGGNMEKVVESEIVFKDPESYTMLAFEDEWEDSGKIGWFVPAYYALNQFKDKNGNTNVLKAKGYLEKERKEKAKAKSSIALHNEKVYRPLIPSEMFLNDRETPYPIEDIKARLNILLTSKALDATYKGFFNLIDGKVKWENTKDRPIREYPFKSYDTTGCVEIYRQPQRLANGSIPSNRYIAALDPVDDDGQGDDLSLQSFFILDTFTETVVCEYTARTKRVKQYYEQVRRALIYFNAMLLYENQKKGIFAHFDNKNSLYRLADTPKMLQDMDMQKPGEGNKKKGVYATEHINRWGQYELGPEWLEKEIGNDKIALDNIMSVGLLREMIAFDGERNTDRISSFGILMIFREATLKTHSRKRLKQAKRLSNDPFWDKHFKSKKQDQFADTHEWNVEEKL